MTAVLLRSLVPLAAIVALGCGDKAAQKPAGSAPESTPGTFGVQPGATETKGLCSLEPTTSTLLPTNHEGHGDGATQVPPGYATERNPCPDTPEVLARGKEVFTQHCARCHGTEGNPKTATQGPLNPPAKTLAVGGYTAQYVYWRVEEGGDFDPFNSLMPSFKITLSEEDAWTVTSYVLSLEGTGVTPLPPTIQSVTPVDGSLSLTWRLSSPCDTLDIERKKDAGAYEHVYKVVGFLTEQQDTAATTAGQYCYRISCRAGGKISDPSPEMCATL